MAIMSRRWFDVVILHFTALLFQSIILIKDTVRVCNRGSADIVAGAILYILTWGLLHYVL